jgi:hypothetical protein
MHPPEPLWEMGGVAESQVIGTANECGDGEVGEKLHVHDLHATTLHMPDFDHTLLTYFRSGRNVRLPDVAGEVAPQLDSNSPCRQPFLARIGTKNWIKHVSRSRVRIPF